MYYNTEYTFSIASTEWLVTRRRNKENEIEMASPISDEDSTASCDSCGRSFAFCSCTSSETHTKEPYVSSTTGHAEVEPGDGSKPEDALLVPKPESKPLGMYCKGNIIRYTGC